MGHSAITRRAFVIAALAARPARAAADAAGYPNRPPRIVVPDAPGSPQDVRSRQLAARLTELWRQQVIVENRPGAGGNIALAHVLESPADGYTVLNGAITGLAILPHLFRQPVDALRELTPVTNLSAGPMLLGAWPGAPFDSLRSMITHAKAHPGRLALAAGVVGSSTHLGLELLNRRAGIALRHIPYAGKSTPFGDVASGVVPLVLNFAPALLPFLQSGRIRALAVAGERRLAVLPDVPTFDEHGLDGLHITGWQGLFVRAGTPAAIVGALHEAVAQVLSQRELRDAMTASGSEIGGDSPEAFAAFVRDEHARWGRVIRDAGIKAE